MIDPKNAPSLEDAEAMLIFARQLELTKNLVLRLRVSTEDFMTVLEDLKRQIEEDQEGDEWKNS